MEENPYTPPKALLAFEKEEAENLLPILKYGSTWKLVLLSIVTLGVYLGFYIVRQNKNLNEKLRSEKKISNILGYSVILMSVLSLFGLFTFFFEEKAEMIELVSDLFDSLAGLLMIVWGFKARNRVNQLLGAEKGEEHWFHGGWTFFLSPFYFNYKVNCLLNSRESGES